ncbi:TIGR02677 family protein [Carbonactinospora thermoautotrophica]|nr:TIGR02677 family protein [Carbonactinospora thermoautotrophica]
MFRFATHDELYLAVMQVFGEANDRLVTALTFDEVLSGLREVGWFDPVPGDRLDRALGQLCEWGLLDRVQNHGAHYATAEEYERKNLQYSLTKRGEAAFEGVQHALYLLASSGALQSAVLDAIAAHLDDLYGLLRDPASDNRRIFTTLAGLEGHLDALRTNTKQFNGELQRLLRDDAADLATFDEVKRATVAYLEEFVTDLDVRKHAIAAAIARVEELGVAVLHTRALAGADLPVLPGAADPAPRWLAQRQAKWDGLHRWFAPLDGSLPAVETLQDIARRAIVSLLRVLERFGEARRRSASTIQDFRTLARWFSACPTDEDAHRLFNAAFGLWPARHAHLALDDSDEVPAATPWHAAPRVPVSPLLRTHGVTEKAARTARVRDVAEIRRRRRARALRERAELEAAWARLATDGTVRLSTFGELDHATFARLLHLLGRALSVRPGRDGLRRATTTDGRLEVTLRDPGDGRTATIRTPSGEFTGPDYAVEIRSPLREIRRESRDEEAL